MSAHLPRPRRAILGQSYRRGRGTADAEIKPPPPPHPAENPELSEVLSFQPEVGQNIALPVSYTHLTLPTRRTV